MAIEDKTIAMRLNECIKKLVNRTVQPFPDQTQKPKLNYYNSVNACFFETVNLIVHYDKYAVPTIACACTDCETVIQTFKLQHAHSLASFCHTENQTCAFWPLKALVPWP